MRIRSLNTHREQAQPLICKVRSVAACSSKTEDPSNHEYMRVVDRGWGSINMHDIELVSGRTVYPTKISNYRVNIDQNIFYTFAMRSRRIRPRQKRLGTTSPRSSRSATLNQHSPEYINILNALQTLDNQHSLMLLQATPVISSELLCLRTTVAHQLNRHELCMDYARQALRRRPACVKCLPIYLLHYAEKPQQDYPLRKSVIQAIYCEKDGCLLGMIHGLAQTAYGIKYYKSLLEQLREGGGRLEKIQVLQSDRNSRRIVARSKIQRHEQILFIPKTKLITLELTRTLPLVCSLVQLKVILKSPKHTQLAIFLLYHFQMEKQSPFYNYLQTLPLQYSHFPVNYSEKLLHELKGTCFLEMIQHKKQDLRKDYEAILGVDESFGRFGYQRFVQARLLVSSRVFGIVADRVKTDALVPLADMLNHQMPKQTSWYYCDQQQGFVIQSVSEILAGAEVFDSYGQKCNSRYLLNYGFTLPANKLNEVSLQVTLLNILTEGRPTTTKVKFSQVLQSKGFEELISLMRVAAGEQEGEDEDDVITRMEELRQVPFKNVENQIRAWTMLDSSITERLKEYPTSLAQDNKLLLKEKDSDMMNVLRLRSGQKQVFLFFQNMAKRMVRMLGSGRRVEMKLYEAYINSLQLES